MHIDVLRYFVILSQEGSFYAASTKAFISQQGLNKAITSLENELSTKLVVRSHHGVHLTEAGETFLMYARRIVADYNAMMKDLISGDYSGDILADPVEIVASSYTLSLISGLTGPQGPFQNIPSICEKPFRRILEDIDERKPDTLYLVDLYPSMFHELIDSKTYAFEPILNTRVGIVWRDGFPLGGKSALHREELTDTPIAYNSHSDMRKWIEDLFKETPLQNVQLITSSTRMLLRKH